MKKLAIGIVIGTILLGAIASVVVYQVKTPPSLPTTVAPQPTPAAPQDQTVAAGRYVSYDEAARAQAGYTTTIIFFHAAWCPECRGFEKAITSGTVPEGVQILKADYDTSKDLRQRYGVTLQSTFVRVAADGSKLASWTGYGKDKTIAVIIENTQ